MHFRSTKLSWLVVEAFLLSSSLPLVSKATHSLQQAQSTCVAKELHREKTGILKNTIPRRQWTGKWEENQEGGDFGRLFQKGNKVRVDNVRLSHWLPCSNITMSKAAGKLNKEFHAKAVYERRAESSSKLIGWWVLTAEASSIDLLWLINRQNSCVRLICFFVQQLMWMDNGKPEKSYCKLYVWAHIPFIIAIRQMAHFVEKRNEPQDICGLVFHV